MNLTKLCFAPAMTFVGMGLASVAVAQVPEAAASGPYVMRLQLVWLCAAVAAIVYAIMIYGLVAAKRPRGTGPASLVGSRRNELLWAVIPAAILIGLALPAVDTLAGLAEAAQQNSVVAGAPAGP